MALAGVLGLVLSACGQDDLPNRVGVGVVVRASTPDRPVVELRADVGGGCNVDGPYQLSIDVTTDDGATTVTVTGHDYDSDDGECAEIASARTEVELPALAPGDRHRLEIVLDDRSSTFVIEATGIAITTVEQVGDNARLSCRDRAEEPATGCTAPVVG